MSDSRIDLPNIGAAPFQSPDRERLLTPERVTHAPRFLLLYGSLRERRTAAWSPKKRRACWAAGCGC